jgi:hypothetical protein
MGGAKNARRHVEQNARRIDSKKLIYRKDTNDVLM